MTLRLIKRFTPQYTPPPRRLFGIIIMKPFEIIATSAFGIESVTARELTNLGYEDIMTENGRVTFRGDLQI